MFSLPLLLVTTLMVLAFCTLGAVGALSYAHSILSLGFAAVAGLSGRYSVLILLGGGSFARIWIDGSGALILATNGLPARS